MHPAGLKAFAARIEKKTGIYAFEQKQPQVLPPACLKQFKANKKAWAFFTAQAPWYQRLIIHKIARAKQEATREKRLATAIEWMTEGKARNWKYQ